MLVDQAGAADSHEGCELHLLLARAVDQLGEHGGNLLDRLVAPGLVVGMAPDLALPYVGFFDLAALARIEFDNAHPHVGAADVDGEDGIVPCHHPAWGEMYGTDQARFVGIVLDRRKLDFDAVGRQHDAGPSHRQLSDPAADHAASDHDALRVLPRVQSEEAANHGRQFAGELLHDGVDEAR